MFTREIPRSFLTPPMIQEMSEPENNMQPPALGQEDAWVYGPVGSMLKLRAEGVPQCTASLSSFDLHSSKVSRSEWHVWHVS